MHCIVSLASQASDTTDVLKYYIPIGCVDYAGIYVARACQCSGARRESPNHG